FKKTFSDKMMEKLEAIYDKYLHKAIFNSKKLMLSVLALFVLAVFLLTRLGGEFIPSLPEGDFAVDTRVLSGSNLKTTTDAVMQSSRVLLAKFPEIEKIVGKTGSSEIPTDPMPIDATDMMVILKPRKEWTSAETYEELSEKMTAELKKNMLGVTFSFQYPVNMRFNELMTGARQDVVIKIFGEDLDTLKVYAEKLGEISKKIEGAENLFVEPISGIPQIIVSYNRGAMARYGLTINEVNRTVNMAFAGQMAGAVYEGEKRFDLVVRLDEKHRKSVEDVQNLLVTTPSGQAIPLREVADVSLKESVNQIQRENTQRRIIVGFNVKNRDIQTTVADLQAQVEQNLKLPAGYFIKYGGTFENLQQAKDRLSIAVPVSLLLILLMLYFTFRSLKYGLLIFTAIPLSAIGGILALWLRDMNFSISAGVGFIALFGVAVLNGIVLVAEFNRQREMTDTLEDAIKIGGKNRLRPVLMTAFVASLGFLPMAISTGEGAEVQRPLATVVIGGLLLATLLTLFLLPILYIWVEKRTQKQLKQAENENIS
ncbi:MAG: efflux RND transporter permease subunit, partial [Capnocytophaga sp.]|nr:efflux RND transporter permease subunit [Capnocytophaga sp.]